MKNKLFKSMVVALLVCLVFSCLPVCAWAPDSAFSISIDSKNIPEGTAYVDLLMPIPSNNEGYVSYNQINGEKYGISENSEIVNYSEDGYRSYTFHIVDADSDMRLSYGADIYVEKTFYKQYKELLDSFNSKPTSIGDEEYYFSGHVYCGSTKEQILTKIEKTVPADIKKHSLCVSFNNQTNDYNFGYCRRNFKYAKMAYLDCEGNIISVSNAVNIGTKPNKQVQLYLNLSGQQFSMDVSTGPNMLLAMAIIALTLVSPFIIIMVIVIIVANIKVKRARKNSFKQ